MHAKTRVGLRVKCLLLLSDFNQNWECPRIFSERSQNQKSRKSVERLSGGYAEDKRCTSVTFHCDDAKTVKRVDSTGETTNQSYY